MKKILALMLVLAMVLALAACGGKTDDKTDDTAKVALPTLTYLYNTSEGHKVIGEYLHS